MRWERWTDKAGLPPKWSGVLITVVGLFLLVLLTLEGLYTGGVVGACLAGSALPVFLEPQRRWSVHENAIQCKQQLPWRNGLLWWAAMFAGMSIAMFVDVATGNSDLRPRILAGVTLVAAAALAGLSFKKRGHLVVAPLFVELAKQRIELRGATIDVIMNGQAPMIRVRQRPNADGSKGPRVLIPPYPYGLDPNTLASAVTQLVRRIDESSGTTSETIAAMLSVEAPSGVPLGGSVVIPLPVEGRIETPPAAR
ncbi:hypothetical protein ACXVUM_13280 [Williamsia sp. SKLECPSW1]